MSKKVFSDLDESREPDNPQETYSHYYFPGFFAAEMSCSIIKAANHPHGHYYAIDITVSNADKGLLGQVNSVVMEGKGVISAIKGGFNLSARGKDKVRTVLEFLERYPVLAGDLAKNRIVLLKRALQYLESHKGHNAHPAKTKVMSDMRRALRSIKTKQVVEKSYEMRSISDHAVGYFLSGIVDGDGSFGVKAVSSFHKEPYFFVAMKDQKIVELLRSFINYGKVRYRKDGVYHYEVNRREILKNICSLFLERYPLRHAGQRRRLKLLKRILNDHTPSPPLFVRAGGMIWPELHGDMQSPVRAGPPSTQKLWAWSLRFYAEHK